MHLQRYLRDNCSRNFSSQWYSSAIIYSDKPRTSPCTTRRLYRQSENFRKLLGLRKNYRAAFRFRRKCKKSGREIMQALLILRSCTCSSTLRGAVIASESGVINFNAEVVLQVQPLLFISESITIRLYGIWIIGECLFADEFLRVTRNFSFFGTCLFTTVFFFFCFLLKHVF